jgi:hypothetical protein
LHNKDNNDVEYCQSDDEESNGDDTEEGDNNGDVIVASGDVYINVRNSGGCWGPSGGYGGHGDDSHSGVVRQASIRELAQRIFAGEKI